MHFVDYNRRSSLVFRRLLFTSGSRIYPRRRDNTGVRWKKITPQLYFDKPAVIAANLDRISSLEEAEIDIILSTLGAMTEFSESLDDARKCTTESESLLN